MKQDRRQPPPPLQEFLLIFPKKWDFHLGPLFVLFFSFYLLSYLIFSDIPFNPVSRGYGLLSLACKSDTVHKIVGMYFSLIGGGRWGVCILHVQKIMHTLLKKLYFLILEKDHVPSSPTRTVFSPRVMLFFFFY